ncbi:DUF4214 domain-containing protein [Hominifimenecus sp. rT4P-3]|uniref:DUF4214 domain-containing protein n=1 Tax=Hominifimenecus sp. rT4P-3 TaxID=3242979 RepID=UPI003DA268EC
MMKWKQAVSAALVLLMISNQAIAAVPMTEESLTDLPSEEQLIVEDDDSEKNDAEHIESLEGFSTTEKETIVDSGFCGKNGGENVSWKITGTEDTGYTLTISGEGDMRGYGDITNPAPWNQYRPHTLILEEGITEIGEFAFMNSSFFSGELVLPDSLTTIGSAAFWGCTGFSGGLIIPGNVKSIGESAFLECTGLDGRLVILEGITEIGDTAFAGCTGFYGKLELPKSVKQIGAEAFASCSGFSGVDLAEVSKIGGGAFFECTGLTGNLVLPETLETIQGGAFRGCSGLTGVLRIPAGVKTVGSGAFQNCSGFSELELTEGLLEIEEEAFSGCAGFREEVIIPSSVTAIGRSAFERCSKLERMQFLNPDCSIYDSESTIDSIIEIFGVSGSTAVAYAERYDRFYSDMSRGIYCADGKIYFCNQWSSATSKEVENRDCLTALVVSADVEKVDSSLWKMPFRNLKTVGFYSGTVMSLEGDLSGFASSPIDRIIYMVNKDTEYAVSKITSEGIEFSSQNNSGRWGMKPKSSCEISTTILVSSGKTLKLENPRVVGEEMKRQDLKYLSIETVAGGRIENNWSFDTTVYCDDVDYFVAAGQTFIAPAGTVKVYVGPKDNIPHITFSKEDFVKAVLTEEDQAILQAGQDIAFWMTVSERTEANLRAEELAVLRSELANNTQRYKPGLYMKLSLEKQIGQDGELVPILVLPSSISVCFEIPEELRKSDRRYTMIGFTDKREDLFYLFDLDDDDSTFTTHITYTDDTNYVLTYHDHVYGAWEETTAPSCVRNGERQKACSCGDRKSEVIQAAGHKAGAWTVAKQASCTERGERVQKCTVCGSVLKTAEIPASAHNWEPWQVERAATTTSTGSKVRFCRNCSRFERTTIAKLPVTDPVEGFVYRLYEQVLGRQPEAQGMRDWTQCLHNRAGTGAQVASGFIFSMEYERRNVSDSEFVEMLYRTMMNRQSDAAGKQSWLRLLKSGVTRHYVFAGFVYSQEFQNVCRSYGIDRGDYTLGEVVDQNADVTAFASRMYTVVLERPYDKEGLSDWTRLLLSHEMGGGELSKGFFNSREFGNKHLSDRDFVTICYRTYLNREPDSRGLNDWLAVLGRGSSREEVLDGFIWSREFGKLCNEYGINP